MRQFLSGGVSSRRACDFVRWWRGSVYQDREVSNSEREFKSHYKTDFTSNSHRVSGAFGRIAF